MNLLPSDNTVIEDGLDRHNVAIIRQRFMTLNEERLERMRGALSDRQQLFMDVLPLLFHTNHPMMPGFVSRQTPARIANYKPQRHDILAGKMVAKSFTIGFDPSEREDIYSIYIMGSVGTIAQGEGSDIDVWLCHRPGLPKKALKELQQKCDNISIWAMKMRLEVHFFLMDNEAFKARKLTSLNKESSGSAQRVLLLDEFYRTAIYIAGRMPLWWHVPVDSEDCYREYTNTLLYKRFIPDSSVLDFGGIAEIPPGEFLGAGIWQLYKGIESPYKSVLKLLLLEAYVADHPNIVPLSHTFKDMIYQGDIDVDTLDGYVMIYQRIEQYLLSRKQYKRLELARRCFYFKVNKKVSQPATQYTKSWQRCLLEDFVDAWGWEMEDIRFLDSRSRWRAADVQRERNLLVAELNHGYRFLLEFANASGAVRAISSDELLVLGRKLQAAFERRPGKIEWINPGISSEISERELILAEIKSEKFSSPVWTAFSNSPDAPDTHTKARPSIEQFTDDSRHLEDKYGAPIKSSLNLIELILWCYFNGVIAEHTHIEPDEDVGLNGFELKRLLGTLRAWLPVPLKPLKHDVFQKMANPEAVLFLINAGSTSASELIENGYQRMSAKSDALSYGGFEENLVVSIDMVVRNSWNEVTTRRFDGEKCLLDATSEYLQLTLPGTHQRPPQFEVVCIGDYHAAIIAQRVEKWMNEITQCFFANTQAQYNRFIFQLANSCYCLQFIDMKPDIRGFKADMQLIEGLEQELQEYSPIIIDSRALVDHPLRMISKGSGPNAIDVFYRRLDIGVEIYVVDERGSVFLTMSRGRSLHNPLKPLNRFLRAALYRQANIDSEFSGDFGIYPINIMELVQSEEGGYQAQARKLSNDTIGIGHFDVKAVAYIGADNELSFDYYCEDQEFCADTFGNQLDLVFSQYILSLRDKDSRYPLYITDLDLSLAADHIATNGRLQLTHYLQIKRRLEAQLNHALGILLNA